MKIKLFLTLCALATLAIGCNNQKRLEPIRPTVNSTSTLREQAITIGEAKLQVEIADTPETRSQGLSDREKLDDGYGMLFVFDSNDTKRPGFWMKNMNFDLDIIWIKQNQIIGISPNVPKPADPKILNSNLPIYYPPSDVDSVLEVPSGWSTQHQIKVGDYVSLK